MHTACSYDYKIVCCYDGKYTKPVKIYQGEDSIEVHVGDAKGGGPLQ